MGVSHLVLVFSFPGSAWERTVSEALPRVLSTRQAEPARQGVPRQSLGNEEKAWQASHPTQAITSHQKSRIAGPESVSFFQIHADFNR